MVQAFVLHKWGLKVLKKILKKFNPDITRVELVNPDNMKKYVLSIDGPNAPSDYAKFKLKSKWLLGYGKNGALIRRFNIKYLYSLSY